MTKVRTPDYDSASAGPVSISHHHLRLLLSLRPGTAAVSPSLLLRDVGQFSVGWGLHTNGGPVKWEARLGE